ncbi:tRNA (adenosine(37)-N6)-dimethylallyltransferase MiaA [Lactobacillus taiwanensis]|uniref:tRNA (adenosine(37)-N6)-dimethylallyltransferase MiaA n=1 Tax=Lactobacillus taiwanensis TaxID=508451 RepID=UPI000B99BEDF|nr:tRNA (adenosine(37)-N6)-dimethylallyltransferase MiaA [Lactobacillus taiwanensis]MRM97846.1 tRNA (adenosine(37)-N6)-dimethylallyltransferase MiaA [Lactobacillus taiwanensis]OYS00426.1 tRNA (adenosine(37)-N6)-dimethylallyltransferase MiaA [Lactobacillus taiwanensis]OYS03867.1 tRNA (adenosine(37)-N6)-dimethylallyltransferase MiaA [Lactobacillus taiwanensis]
MQKIIVIIGPTGIGKTELALDLAPKINAEILSGDSMQIYQEVSIGTAKPTFEELKKVKHYLVNQRSIFDEYSVKDFVAEGIKAVDEIVAKDAVPLVVGGTGFYINALVNKLQLGEPGEYQTSVDSKWEEYLKKNGEEELWRVLHEKDPAAADKIAPQNSRRTLRALTVIDRTGKLFSKQQKKITPRYDALIIGLNSSREEVYHRINKRVDKMMDLGLLKEAKFVYENRDREHQAIQAIGYKEFFPYFSGEKTLDDCVSKLKQASRKYAKRQLTYFKHQLQVTWLDPLQDKKVSDHALEEINNFLNK